MEPMTDELKETIIREHPDGIWFVLTEEYSPTLLASNDLFCQWASREGDSVSHNDSPLSTDS